jgi:transposase
MRVYVGMDVHRKRSQVALVDEHGVQLANRNLADDSGELVAVLGRLEPGTPVAFEAAYGWGWLAELLDELSLEPQLVHPSRCKANRRSQAQRRPGRCPHPGPAAARRAAARAWIAPQAVRDQRGLLRHRAALVRVVTALKCRVHAVLADRGVGVQEPLWGPAGRVLLAELALPAVQRTIVTDCLALIDAISPLVARLERQLIARARPDPGVQALQALPGIGPITAMPLVAEIGDIGRFPTARKLCAWAGLTPAVRNSDRKVRHGHITKMGSPWVRLVLQEAAQRAKTRPPFATYAKTAARRGKHIATVAVARKLLARCFHLLTELETTAEEGQPPGALAPSHVPETRPKD